MSRQPNDVESRCAAARRAGARLSAADGPTRRLVLLAIADALERPQTRRAIVEANAKDVADAEAALTRGELSRALVDRLLLSEAKLDGLCEGLEQLAAKADIIGVRLEARELDDGLVLERVSCPLGVLGVVFEARPDAVVQIAGLAIRTGNAVVLKGGAEAQRTNEVLVRTIGQAVGDQGFDPQLVVLLEGRQEVRALIESTRGADLIVARGSSAFVEFVQTHAKTPVLGHAEGICHLYLHPSAAPDMAAAIAVDAKCSYPAACNAIETLLWSPGAEPATRAAIEALAERSVRLLGCSHSAALDARIGKATDEDWSTEYGDLVLSLRRVDDLEAALAHIDTYGSGHTEAILAADEREAAEFLARVDAAGVFHNASTRFADGFRFGLGAEVGVSTSKLHARGPVGVEGLVTYRWLLRGRGQVASDYGPGRKAFTHRNQ